MTGIYKIENLINGKKYIGQAKNIRMRWQEEKKLKKITRLLKEDIKKYNINNFSFEVLEETNDLNNREKYWIAFYNSFNEGYNLTTGGSFHTEIHESTIKILKEKSSGKNNARYGIKLTNEEKQKISNVLKEKYKNGLINSRLGKHLSEETKEKLRIKQIGKYIGGKSPRAKKVICLETNEIFDSISKAAIWCNIKSSADISTCCKNKSITAGIHPITNERLHWKYYDDFINNNIKFKKEKLRKKVICLETNEIFDSISEAGRTKKIDISFLCKCCKNGNSAKGFHWRYL
ncbi:MAG: GIY-YIG nuclease family protein [Elusimicrobiota bacterium]|jgi:group I intron endonuclease|nr:GIY-YIG nuclease family protein [Elusimicrobiota bacterium]